MCLCTRVHLNNQACKRIRATSIRCLDKVFYPKVSFCNASQNPKKQQITDPVTDCCREIDQNRRTFINRQRILIVHLETTLTMLDNKAQKKEYSTIAPKVLNTISRLYCKIVTSVASLIRWHPSGAATYKLFSKLYLNKHDMWC